MKGVYTPGEGMMGYDFLPGLFLRAPFYSFERYDLAGLPAVLQEQAFRNALWLASPVFYARLAEKHFDFDALNDKERFTLAKYFNRMCYRPTPFGSFATFTLLEWADGTPLQLAAEGEALLTLLPDRALSRSTFRPGRPFGPETLVRPNPTLYRLGPFYRYIHTAAGPKGRYRFTIDQDEAVAFNRALLGLFAGGPVPAGAVAGWIAEQMQCPAAEAQDELRFLLEDQFLYTSGQGTVIGSGSPEALPAFWAAWARRPLRQAGDLTATLPEVAALFAERAESPKKAYYYAALERPALGGGPAAAEQAELLAAVRLLQRLALPPQPGDLARFTAGFRARFDREQVPLLVALDPDGGVSYGDRSAAHQGDLLDGLPLPPKGAGRPLLDWGGARPQLLSLWLDDPARPAFAPLVLNEAAVAALGTNGLPLPPSLPVLFRQAEGHLLLEQVAGASATQFIARFSLFSPEARDLCRRIAEAEAAANPGILFADIGQLSDSYVDNINRRARIYPSEVPLNVYPQQEAEATLPLSDLLLCVRGGELVLVSASRGRRVIPRLASAYNYHHNELPLFRFLCDLQYQGLQANLGLDLARFYPGLNFYPRVVYRRTILALAKWLLDEKDLALLRGAAAAGLAAFRQARGLPALVSLGESDQQLVFDLDRPEETRFFLACLEQKKEACLQEYLRPSGDIRSATAAFAGHYLAFLRQKDPVYPPLKPERHPRPRSARRFLPGSDWLYVKVYCTAPGADQLLRQVIGPLIRSHRERIRSWFFIRYADPGHHLRLRIRVQGNDIGPLLVALKMRLKKSGCQVLVSALVCDTYQLELERYGSRYIALAEAVFCAGSQLFIACLGSGGADGDRAFRLAWLTALKMVRAFLPDAAAAAAFAGQVRDEFLREFDRDKTLKVHLDMRYRELRPVLAACTSPQGGLFRTPGEQAALQALEARLRELAGRMSRDRPDTREGMLADLVHMQLNRTFLQSPRPQELLVYHCLAKYLAGERAQAG